MSNYFAGLKLSLNRKKTKVLNIDRNIRRTNIDPFPNLMVNGEQIESVKSFNYLGIKIDKSLKMNIHLNNCVRKAYGKLYLLGKVRRYMDSKTALCLFKSMVLPYIEYGNSFLLGSDIAMLNKLQRAQNRGLKIALAKDMRYSTGILHKEARLASWEVRARMAAMRLMFKYKHNDEYTEACPMGSSTRAHYGPLIIVDKPKTTNYSKSISYMCRKEWNSLPAYIRCIDECKKFKKELKLLYEYRYFQCIDNNG